MVEVKTTTELNLEDAECINVKYYSNRSTHHTRISRLINRFSISYPTKRKYPQKY